MKRNIASVVIIATVTAAVGLGSQASAHDAANFSTASFRWAEDRGDAAITIERGTHGSGEASVQMTAEAITAAEGADFIGGTHTVRFSTPVEQAEVFLPVIDDDEVEDIEVVGLGLEQPTNGMVIAFPGTAEMSIIDDDGPSRVGFEDAEYSVFESRSSVDLWVIRAGSDSAPASVGYSTSDGTAVAGEDYASRSGTLSFGAGERAKRISVGIIDDGSASGEVSFDLTLGSPSGAELMTASARVVIRDDEGSVPADDTPPYTAFHQPLHGKVYRPGVVEEFLVFTQDDEQGSGIRKVEVALRKKLTSGRCAWWTGAGFRRGSCGEVRWSKEKGDYFTELTLFTMTKLKPSTKANGIRFYTAYSRGIDNVGNVQTALDRGQNRNDFEVRR